MVTPFDVVHELPTHTETVPLAVPLEVVLVAEIVTDVPLVTETALITPVLLTVTAAGSELLQVVDDDAVRFFVLPSLNVPVAVNWSVWSTFCSEGLAGVMVILDSVGSTKKPLQPTIPLASNTAPHKSPTAAATLSLEHFFSLNIV